MLTLLPVNWRKTVVSTLISNAAAKTSSSLANNLSLEVRTHSFQLKDSDWAQFAQEWINSYKKFTTGFKPGESEWRDVDAHHYFSLVELLEKWHLEGL